MRQQSTKRANPSRAETDLSGLRRLGLWGGAAAASLLAVALAIVTETGSRRAASAYASLSGSAQSAAQEQERKSAQRDRDAQIEAQRVTESLRNLSDDRDRLLARMTALERNYEDVTGSIGRLTNAQKPSAESPAPQPELPPIATAPATTAPAAPAERNAAATPAPEQPEGAPARSEFGVDVGSGPTLASLRAAWNQMRRNHATLLDGLRPVIAVREGKGGQVELRLVVGPINNAAAAARLCAQLATAGLSCQPTLFDGQRLALR